MMFCTSCLAIKNIIKIQAENKKGFNKNRIKAQSYNINDLIAVKRTQFGPGLKLKPKFIGPYKVIKKLAHDRYQVEKVGDVEGPLVVNTVAEYMKKWGNNALFGPNNGTGRPNVGSGCIKNTRSGHFY